MKKRVYQNIDDNVFKVLLLTHDWSEGDLELMFQFGEPEINVGGVIEYVYEGEFRSRELGDQFVRVVHGFPYERRFDARDCDYGIQEAMAIGKAWKEIVLERIDAAVVELRSKVNSFPTEEVSEI